MHFQYDDDDDDDDDDDNLSGAILVFVAATSKSSPASCVFTLPGYRCSPHFQTDRT